MIELKRFLLILWSVSIMLNIPEQTKIAFLKDSTQKELRIDGQYTSIDDINFYCGSYIGTNTHAEHVILEDNYSSHLIWWDNSLEICDSTNDKGTSYRDYVCLSFYIRFDEVSATANTVGINLMKFSNPEHSTHTNESKTLTVSDYNEQYKRVSFTFDASSYYGIGVINIYPTETNTTFDASMTIKQAQLDYGDNADFLPREDNLNQANMQFDFDTANMFPLTNANIEFESFSLTESLCSQDNIKFGLCESAHCDFTVVNKPYNFSNQIIRPSISVNREMTDEEISRINFQYDQTGHYHAGDTFTRTATLNDTSFMWTSQWLIGSDIASYDKYFDSHVYIGYLIKFNNIDVDTTPTYFKIGYIVETENRPSVYISSATTYTISDYSDYNVVSFGVTYNRGSDGKITQVTRPYLIYCDENKNELRVTGSIEYSIKDIQIYARTKANRYDNYNIDDCMVENGTLEDYEKSTTGTVPLGTFRIKEVKTENTKNMIKKHITAYDDLLLLEQNSADWYTRYMFGINFADYECRYGFQFARQIYSTFFNFAKNIGIENRNNYTETIFADEDWTEIRNHLSDKYISWDNGAQVHRIRYAYMQVQNAHPDTRYVVDITNVFGETDEQIVAGLDFDNFDELKRGVGSKASVLIVEDTGNQFLCDSGDYFMISKSCESFYIYIPYATAYEDGTTFQRLIDNVKVSQVDDICFKLINGSTRLVYYNYMTKSIFACESSITGRDVVRSLLEPCGCFFRLSREKGIPEFVYCTRYGLYPSETLYPADDLYPRETVDGELLPLGRYVSLVSDEYRVHNYARIQILKSDKSNDTKSVCEWEYVGDRHGDNTYIIGDNIFYCNDAMIYDYDNMFEVSEMLENMFTAINNMGYVPNQVTALGMPWVECGDRIGLLTLNSGVDSFIFRRTLSGIQLLMDNYEAVGDEYTEAIKDFGYTIYN